MDILTIVVCLMFFVFVAGSLVVIKMEANKHQ
jgi:hypothetical protein